MRDHIDHWIFKPGKLSGFCSATSSRMQLKISSIVLCFVSFAVVTAVPADNALNKRQPQGPPRQATSTVTPVLPPFTFPPANVTRTQPTILPPFTFPSVTLPPLTVTSNLPVTQTVRVTTTVTVKTTVAAACTTAPLPPPPVCNHPLRLKR